MSSSRPAISSAHGLAKCCFGCGFLFVLVFVCSVSFFIFFLYFFLIIATIDVLKEGKEFQTNFAKEVVLLR